MSMKTAEVQKRIQRILDTVPEMEEIMYLKIQDEEVCKKVSSILTSILQEIKLLNSRVGEIEEECGRGDQFLDWKS